MEDSTGQVLFTWWLPEQEFNKINLAPKLDSSVQSHK